MKSNAEIRRQTWNILSGKWFLRLLVVGAILQIIAAGANRMLSAAFEAAAITPLSDYLEEKIRAMQQGLDYALPTAKAHYWMLAGFGLQMFINYIFAAIVTFGFMRVLLRAHANDDSNWFSCAFGGFSQPFSVTALLFVQNLFVSLWSLLFLIPGIVALYRYRLAWFIKTERDDLPALACIDESSRMMKGHKSQAFMLDLSFIGWLMLTCVILAVATILGNHAGNVTPILSFIVGFAGFYLLARTILGLAVSRAVFYRELTAGQIVTNESPANTVETPGGTSAASSDSAQ